MFLLPNFGAVGTKHCTQHDNNKITRTRVWNRKYDLSESKNTRLQSSSCFVIIFHSKVDKATWILCKKGSCLRTQNSNECTIVYFLNVYIKWILRIYTCFYSCGATSVMFIISECLFLSIVAARTIDQARAVGPQSMMPHTTADRWTQAPASQTKLNFTVIWL